MIICQLPTPESHAWHLLSACEITMYLHVCMLSHVWLFVTPWTEACQTPLSMGFSGQEDWSGLLCLPPQDLSDPGIEPVSPVALELQADSLLLSHWGSPVCIWACIWLYSRASTYQHGIRIWFLYHFISVGWNFILYPFFCARHSTVAAAAKSLQSCPTMCNPRYSSPPGSPIPGILQARTLEWVAISFSNAWKWKVKVKSLSPVWLLATPWTATYQAPPSMGFSRQENWSGVPLPSPDTALESRKLKLP